MATAIVAQHYRDAEAFYSNQTQTIEMAADVFKARLLRDEMAHEDGTPTASFMGRCNARYKALGGAHLPDAGGMGSIARAVLEWVDTLEEMNRKLKR